MAVSNLGQGVVTPPHEGAESDSSTPPLISNGDVEKNLSSSSSDEAAASIASEDEGQRTIKGFKVGRIELSHRSPVT